ncbi:cell filamentation protein Fic [Hymenobacter psoromatis]|nr:cell filamentation protein Fic [Hymenobacter psoromatis]
MNEYIYQQPDWPAFIWQAERLQELLAHVRHHQGRLLGRMEGLGFALREEATLQTLMLDVLKSSEIEGELLPPEQVRSSVARGLGLEVAGLVASGPQVEGVVAMLLNATQQFDQDLTTERLFGWQAALFPTGRSGLVRIRTRAWRLDSTGPMQVVSGTANREIVHFEAPGATRLPAEMTQFLAWFNGPATLDPVLKAALAHLWFITLHPFEDGNGRLARALTDLQLARANGSAQRFYSMSAQIQRESQAYYTILERTQRGSLDVTAWLTWFLECLGRALAASEQTIAQVLRRARFWERHAAAALNERQRLLLGRLLAGFEGKLTSSKWAKIAKCSQDTATRDIQALMALGILARDEAGGRSTSYYLPEGQQI